jgi:dihydrofolate reductase
LGSRKSKLEAKPKHVVSSSRRDFPWNNTFRVEGDLHEAVKQVKEKTPQGVLVGSPMLSAALERLGLIDEYRLVLHPVLVVDVEVLADLFEAH